MAAELCKRRYCRTILFIGTDGNGQTVATCPSCARNAKGLCRDCRDGRLENPRAMRCASCSLERLRTSQSYRKGTTRRPERNQRGLCLTCPATLEGRGHRASYCAACSAQRKRLATNRCKRTRYRTDPAYRKRELQKATRRYHTNPEVRAKNIARAKARYKTQPKQPELDRAAWRAREAARNQDPQKKARRLLLMRRAYQKRMMDPVYRAKMAEKDRQYRARRRAKSVIGTISPSSPSPMEQAS